MSLKFVEMEVSPLRALTLFLDSFIVTAFAKHIGSSRRTPCGRTPLTESGLAFSVVRPLQTVEYMRPAFDMRLKE